jgi:hypothetical protein
VRWLRFQHAPSAQAANSHRSREAIVLRVHNSFGQDVGNLVICWSILKSNLFTLDFVPQKMVSHFNVLGAIMELGVPCDGDGRLIIDMEDSWGAKVEA